MATPTGRKRAAEALAHVEEEPDSCRRPRRRVGMAKRAGVKIIAGPRGHKDACELERERLLDRVLAAEGRPSITRTVEDFLGAGFELPKTQDVYLQVLEHNDEERVADAIVSMTEILQEEPPRRRAVLESRLRRIEELADESKTQDAAGQLRRILHTKYAETL